MILDVVGFDAALKGDQTSGALLNLRLAYSLVPAAFMILGIYLAMRYPLTEAILSKYRVELEGRRGVV